MVNEQSFLYYLSPTMELVTFSIGKEEIAHSVLNSDEQFGVGANNLASSNRVASIL